MRDLTNLIQVLTPLLLGYLTYTLNNKKEDRDYLKDENDRLNNEVKHLQEENEKLRKEISKNEKH